MMQYTPTPYESALRLQADYGKARPKEGEGGTSVYRRRTLRPEGTPDWHLMVILESEYVICPYSEHQITVAPGQAVLYPPHMAQDNMLHHDYQTGKTFWAHFFPEVTMMPFLKWPKSKVGPGILKWDVDGVLHHKIQEACGRCVAYLESDYDRRRSLALLALEEILRLIYQVHPGKDLKRLDDRVALALQYMAENIREPLKIKHVAGVTGLSASRFSHIFSDNMKCGVMEYIENQRMNMACSMLTHTELPVSVISGKCGFSSADYFAKRFRKLNDLSPSEYRQQSTE
ncbi:helix-turn-helix transcriptional regulator [Verrucomicrobiaceae bacterium N1E253]|uniref:Helix-turn-helix transcriptional regulator n=1 Tax=Oceaniferula marina TaxID=2748318 RepID=A0A851GKJ2_9BACT|nr:AraC family transcriptional regulator [Oceaniferula marina]NWK55240.1 helix-turn-helix transcriptional regulator [Oceaniferula marina]